MEKIDSNDRLLIKCPLIDEEGFVIGRIVSMSDSIVKCAFYGDLKKADISNAGINTRVKDFKGNLIFENDIMASDRSPDFKFKVTYYNGEFFLVRDFRNRPLNNAYVKNTKLCVCQ